MVLQQHHQFGENQHWLCAPLPAVIRTAVCWEFSRNRPRRHVRAVQASGHSWSGIAADADIMLDLSNARRRGIVTVDGQALVRVGAGCRLKDLLRRLHAATDRTLPTLGAITQQTIAGAISTGTHGSGRQSLSHFVTGSARPCSTRRRTPGDPRVLRRSGAARGALRARLHGGDPVGRAADRAEIPDRRNRPDPPEHPSRSWRSTRRSR